MSGNSHVRRHPSHAQRTPDMHEHNVLHSCIRAHVQITPARACFSAPKRANVGGKCVGCPCPGSELEAEHDAGPDEEGPAVGAACGNQNKWDVARARGDEHSYMFTSRGDMDVVVLSPQEVEDEATA